MAFQFERLQVYQKSVDLAEQICMSAEQGELRLDQLPPDFPGATAAKWIAGSATEITQILHEIDEGESQAAGRSMCLASHGNGISRWMSQHTHH